MSKRMLCPTITASPMNSRKVGRAVAISGASTTIASVMPVRIVIKAVWEPGIDQGLKGPQQLAAPVFDRPDLGDGAISGRAPGVSRSRTQKVTSNSGVDRSSKLGWSRLGTPSEPNRTYVRCK